MNPDPLLTLLQQWVALGLVGRGWDWTGQYSWSWPESGAQAAPGRRGEREHWRGAASPAPSFVGLTACIFTFISIFSCLFTSCQVWWKATACVCLCLFGYTSIVELLTVEELWAGNNYATRQTEGDTSPLVPRHASWVPSKALMHCTVQIELNTFWFAVLAIYKILFFRVVSSRCSGSKSQME